MLFHALLLTTGITFVAVFLFFKLKFSYWRRLGVSNPKPSFPFGNIDGRSVQMAFSIDKHYHDFKNAAGLPFFGIYFMHKPWAVLTDVDLIKKMLVSDFQTFPERDVYVNEKDDPLSAHLSTVEFHKWRRIRPRLSPSFTSGRLHAMFPVMVECCAKIDQFLVGEQPQQMEVKDMLGRVMTDIVGRCIFGIECNSLLDATDEFRKMGKMAFVVPRFSGLTINVIKSWKSASRLLGVKVTLDDVSSFFLKFIRELVDYREENEIDNNDLVDLLIRMKNLQENPLTVKEIAAQSFILFLAGFEIASLVLAFTLYELALNPDIQCRAREEILAAVDQQTDGILTYDAMMKLTYVEKVLNESVRKYPPVPVMTRMSTADYSVPNTNIVLPKGSTVLVNVYSIHHDAEHFPKPDLFDPERFSTEGQASRSNGAFLAFGAGPRNCIGGRFGMMQCRVALVALLRAYDFSPSAKTPPKMEFDERGILLTPKGGVWLNMTKRTM